MTFELGVYSFGNTPRLPDGSRGPTAQALRDVLEAIKLADEVGLDYFGVGEHHMRAMPLSSPTSVVNAAAAATRRIKLGGGGRVRWGRRRGRGAGRSRCRRHGARRTGRR
ncbi:LLM class flavin-dependent oxidoreductase [Streptomyces sp. NPDC013178]|uniref:LLM class flavin-dependent oxidoreductase n=1 Tax=unclassified Streptomyces TaxID=2593676 RepID=UPI0033FBB039